MNRFVPCVLSLLLIPGTLLRAEGETALTVTYLENQLSLPEPGYAVVRSAFEVEGPPHRWIALDVEFRLAQAIPLVRPDGKAFLKRWNDLFLPDSPRPVRWTDCRLEVDFRELEQTGNWPKEAKTFVVWAMGLVYDHAAGRHIGSGWSVRAPLVLTTDSSGRIQTVRAPSLPPILLLHPSQETIPARRMTIRTDALTPAAGVKAYQIFRRDGMQRIVLETPRGQIWRRQDYGGAFEAIDTEEKARELVLLRHGGGIILSRPDEYQAVLDTARQLGWPAKELPAAPPTSFGLRCTPVEGLGWQIDLLLVEARRDGLGDLAAWQYFVCFDGRVGAKRKILLRAPREGSAASVGREAYTAAVWSHLPRPEFIASRFHPAEEIATLPLPAVLAKKDFLPMPASPAPSDAASRIVTTAPLPIRKSP